MLFPNEDDVARTWKLVAEGVADNRLGDMAKIAAIEPDADFRGGRLICVYTRNYFDKGDVQRVLRGLLDLGLVDPDNGRGIYYKTDAYTHLDLKSSNRYGLRASKYSSKEFLTLNTSQKRSIKQSTVPQKRQATLSFAGR